jgi:hypothetical protein
LKAWWCAQRGNWDLERTAGVLCGQLLQLVAESIIALIIGFCLIGASAVGIAGGALGIFAPEKVPDSVHPIKNRKLFAIMFSLNLIIFILACSLIRWAASEAALTSVVAGLLLAALILFVGYLHSMRHRNETAANPWLKAHFPDIREAVGSRSFSIGRNLQIGERIAIGIVCSVLSSLFMSVLGLEEGMELVSVGVGG